MSVILGIVMAVTIIASRNHGYIALTTGILYVVGLTYTVISVKKQGNYDNTGRENEAT